MMLVGVFCPVVVFLANSACGLAQPFKKYDITVLMIVLTMNSLAAQDKKAVILSMYGTEPPTVKNRQKQLLPITYE